MSIVPCYQNVSHPKLIFFFGRSLLFGSVLKANSVFARKGNLLCRCRPVSWLISHSVITAAGKDKRE
jgi:hypothetical protein